MLGWPPCKTGAVNEKRTSLMKSSEQRSSADAYMSTTRSGPNASKGAPYYARFHGSSGSVCLIFGRRCIADRHALVVSLEAFTVLARTKPFLCQGRRRSATPRIVKAAVLASAFPLPPSADSDLSPSTTRNSQNTSFKAHIIRGPSHRNDRSHRLRPRATSTCN